MPNWVTTKITAAEEVIQALLRQPDEVSPKLRVDFNNIIPQPEDLYKGSLGSKEEALYPGELNWYGWSLQNWGTKWNATEMSLDDSGTEITFDTAWSHPEPVVKKLSEMFPSETLSVAFANEDIGSGLGFYRIKNGIITIGPYSMNPPLSFEFAHFIKWGESYAVHLENSLDWYDQEIPEEKQYWYDTKLEIVEHKATVKAFTDENGFPVEDYISLLDRLDKSKSQDGSDWVDTLFD